MQECGRGTDWDLFGLSTGGQNVFANESNQHGDVISNDRRCVHDLAKSPS